MASNTLEHDAIHNKISVLLASNQRLLASLPALKRKRKEDLPHTRSEQEIEKEEQDMFTPEPELLGFGARIPKDVEVKREDLSSNNRLRKQLLGTDYMKKQKKKAHNGGVETVGGSKPLPANAKRIAESDSEDDGGRSSLGKARRTRKWTRILSDGELVNEAASELPESKEYDLDESLSRKKASNYLDEVLADRTLQKRKRSKQRRQPVVQPESSKQAR